MNLDKALKTAEKLGFQRGFIAGKADGFDEGVKFFQQAHKIHTESIFQTAVQRYIEKYFEASQYDRIQAFVLYRDFSEWLSQSEPGSKITLTAFGRQMAKIAQRVKITGRNFYMLKKRTQMGW